VTTTEKSAAFLAAYDAMLARWPGPVDQITVQSRFGTTWVNACGPKDAPTLVLLPGGGATSTAWYANVGPLSQQYRVFAIDPIGDRGRTVYSGEPVRTLADLMTWLDSCLAGLNIMRTRLAGHSYGAWILLRYALAKPHRVQRLALLDPTQCFTSQRRAYLLHALPLLVAPGRRTKRRFFTWETGGTMDPQFLNFVTTPYAVDTPAEATFIFPRRPADAEFVELTSPTLVLAAERGQQNNVRRLTATARRLVPDVTVTTIAGATHHTMPMQPADEINRALLDFLAGAR
jgi:pimeloyl-ACP methyl ester carboxylesterase